MEMTAGNQSPEAMFRMAQGLPDARLTAILSGQDNALPQFVAQAVLSERQRIRQAQAGQQAQAQMGQQQLTKKDELLAGVASIAPDDVAEMAGGGIVAFSGEDGDQEVRQPSRGLNDAYRRTGTLLPETSGYEGMGPIDFIRRIFGKGLDAVSRADARLKRRVMQSALPTYTPDISTSDLPSTANSRSPTPSEAAPAAVVPPARGAGGGGGGRAAAPAAAAPAAQPFDIKKYFEPLGKAPTIADVAATNPYEKARSVEEYMTEGQNLRKKFGITEDPTAEYRKELEREKAGLDKQRSRESALNMIQTGALMFGTPGGARQAISGGIAQLAEGEKKLDDKIRTQEKELRKAQYDLGLAKYNIDSGRLKEGTAQRDSALERFNTAELKLADLREKRAETRAQLESDVYRTEAQRGIAMGQVSAQADIEMRKMAQALQISREEIAAKIKAAQISAAASGGQVPSEIQVMEWAQRDPKNMQTFLTMQAGKRAQDPLAALIAGAAGPQGYDPSKVKPIGK